RGPPAAPPRAGAGARRRCQRLRALEPARLTPPMGDPPGRELASASPRESLGFTLRVMLPNLLQGLFRRRPRAVGVATRLGADRHAIRTIGRIRRRHGPGP